MDVDVSRHSEFSLEYVGYIEKELVKNGFLIHRRADWGYNGFIVSRDGKSMGIGIWFKDNSHCHNGIYLQINNQSIIIEHNNPDAIEIIINFYENAPDFRAS